MEHILGSIVSIIIIIGFAATLVKLLIIDPLQVAITALNDAVKELRTILGRIEQEQKNIDIRLTRVEEAVKIANHRIDGIEGRDK